MPLPDLDLGQILVDQNYLSAEDIKKATTFAEKNQLMLRDVLVSQNYLPPALLGQAIAEHFGVLYFDLAAKPPSKEGVLRIPEAIAREYQVVFVEEEKAAIVIATANPQREGLKGVLQPLFQGKDIRFVFCFPETIERQFHQYRKPLPERLAEIAQSQEKVGPRILEEIVADALILRTSDIHMEPQEEQVVLRFRIDGVLQEVGRLGKEEYEALLNRVKVEASLRIDEHFSSQDGSIRYTSREGKVDMRVSVVPILTGEKIVIRVLSEYVRDFTMADLGISDQDQALLDRLARKPFGMILVAGPTGAGKTTTLYALLKQVNRPQVNITTIEDPVEYRISGVNQIQVNEAKGITFAKGLRSIVRQDPNIILVGEIRDQETAEIAVNAALTGHLLFSTFHANDAPTAIPRLLDMGVEPFLLASTLEAVMSQRLLRRICTNCRYSISYSKAEIAKKFPGVADRLTGSKMTLYQGKGCGFCEQTGYRGRVAVFEIIPISDEMEELLLTKPSTAQIWKMARQMGARPMFEDGLEKVKNGLTSMEELLRVVQIS